MIKTRVYLHSSKDSMYELGRKIGLTNDALDMFMNACYEVELELAVNEETGEATITKVDGAEVKR